MNRFELVRESAASPEKVFDLLADAESWSRWAGAMIPWSGWEREGTPTPGGVGAIRVLGSPKRGAREEIIEHERPLRLGYTVLSGLPVRDYVGTITLGPTDGGGTRIHWSALFRPSVPGTGWVVERFLRSMLGRFASRASAYAERL